MDRSDAIKLASSAGIPPARRPQVLAALARTEHPLAVFGSKGASCTILPGSGLDPDDGPTLAVRRLLCALAADDLSVFGPVVVREQPTTEGSRAWVARCITVPVEVLAVATLVTT